MQDKPKLPDEAKLQEALRHVDYRNVEVDGNLNLPGWTQEAKSIWAASLRDTWEMRCARC